jgi:hypothetical protein
LDRKPFTATNLHSYGEKTKYIQWKIKKENVFLFEERGKMRDERGKLKEES